MRLGSRTITVCTAVGLALASLSAWAGEIREVTLGTGATGTRAEIALAGAGGYKTLSLSSPNRLVIDFPDSSAARGLTLPPARGVVTAVRTGQPVPGTFRVVFELAESVAPFRPQMLQQGGQSRLVVEWPGDAPASAARPTPAPAPMAATAAVSPATPAQARTDAARATALLTAQVQRAGATPPPASSPPPAASSTPPATAPTAVAGAAGALSPAAILAGRSIAPPSAPSAVVGAPVATTPAAPVPVVTAAANGTSPQGAAPAVAASESTPAPRPTLPSDASRMRMQAGMRPLVVAIDAGHGGQDPGAVGPTGKREKDITLAVARELARQVNATQGLRAYLTRDTDVFIPLPMRAQKARAAKADIFISIHADAAENRAARGSSVYVLSTKGASSQRARWLADKENAADLIGGVRLQQAEGTLANVLLDLAQSGYMKASEDAATHVLGGLKRIGNNHKPNIERANFAVLRTSDMPAMLVETAFISNPDEERRLMDPAYQRKIAAAVLDGVDTFFTRQPPPGTLYAARAQAEMDAASSTVAGGSK